MEEKFIFYMNPLKTSPETGQKIKFKAIQAVFYGSVVMENDTPVIRVRVETNGKNNSYIYFPIEFAEVISARFFELAREASLVLSTKSNEEK